LPACLLNFLPSYLSLLPFCLPFLSTHTYMTSYI
jgi:hypothetical protein